MKLVYIAGPYTGRSHLEIERNILEAREAGALVAKLGYMPVIPQCNSAFFDDVGDTDFWYAGTLALMKRCDAVVVTARWQQSNGAQREVQEAQAIGLPVVEVDDLQRLPVMLAALEAVHQPQERQHTFVVDHDAGGYRCIHCGYVVAAELVRLHGLGRFLTYHVTDQDEMRPRNAFAGILPRPHVSDEEIEAEIAAVRKERRQRARQPQPFGLRPVSPEEFKTWWEEHKGPDTTPGTCGGCGRDAHPNLPCNEV